MTTGETIQEGPRISPTPAQKAARQILSTFWEKPPERQIQIGRDWLKLKQEQPQQCEEVRREEVQLGRQAWKELARLRDERARKVINILDSNKGNIVEGSRALRELREIALNLPENHPAADAIRSIYSHYAFQALILPGGIETAEAELRKKNLRERIKETNYKVKRWLDPDKIPPLQPPQPPEPPEATVLQPTQTAPQPPAEPTEAPEVTAPIDQAERERQIREIRNLYLSVATPTLAESLAANIQIPPFAYRKDIADAIVSDAEKTIRNAIATVGGSDSGAGIIYDFEVSRYLRGIIEGIGKGNRALVENQHREALEVLPAFLSRFPSTEAQERVNQAVLTLLGRRLLPALRAFQPETPASLRPRDTAEPQVETGGEASAPDPLLDRAREIAQEEGRLSVPRWLQRELHIKYLQAARLMDTLEQEGLLSAEPGISAPTPSIAPSGLPPTPLVRVTTPDDLPPPGEHIPPELQEALRFLTGEEQKKLNGAITEIPAQEREEVLHHIQRVADHLHGVILHPDTTGFNESILEQASENVGFHLWDQSFRDRFPAASGYDLKQAIMSYGPNSPDVVRNYIMCQFQLYALRTRGYFTPSLNVARNLIHDVSEVQTRKENPINYEIAGLAIRDRIARGETFPQVRFENDVVISSSERGFRILNIYDAGGTLIGRSLPHNYQIDYYEIGQLEHDVEVAHATGQWVYNRFPLTTLPDSAAGLRYLERQRRLIPSRRQAEYPPSPLRIGYLSQIEREIREFPLDRATEHVIDTALEGIFATLGTPTNDENRTAHDILQRVVSDYRESVRMFIEDLTKNAAFGSSTMGDAADEYSTLDFFDAGIRSQETDQRIPLLKAYAKRYFILPYLSRWTSLSPEDLSAHIQAAQDLYGGDLVQWNF